jgi:hypothetical protein
LSFRDESGIGFERKRIQRRFGRAGQSGRRRNRAVGMERRQGRVLRWRSPVA